ncbi:hypothetical protein A2961_00815 [Candidatus Woesebacteria bacterium RIFCSPLOWO2_01_FULL_39_21]|uniref:SET domain-containing protein n=1 Tax=Candidatus Woesebacteria bacterium RIFCSPLOWO2_01_FULL_39_21 TaxID=1802519 RepID=A0A1F8BMI7_9BACT|nr:MAG: hypothetical protein A2691_02110 [Candidatus Woesebacteria bacterium RIFCSPHIGHO2_01_FULL_39_23]OGM65222.1 MAG: hypothetical protein A2961_00815 [Candidatus Woesebacteria bacterium RIFCSPLOWO2_01_FULL_39_21]
MKESRRHCWWDSFLPGWEEKGAKAAPPNFQNPLLHKKQKLLHANNIENLYNNPMLHPDVTVSKSDVEGIGLVAARSIPVGTVIWKMEPDAIQLTKDKLPTIQPEYHKFIHHYKDHFIFVQDDRMYINHSCDPNTWWADDETLVAKRDIKENEEVTYDYATTEITEDTMHKFACNCGAADCRGSVTPDDYKDPDFQKLHAGHLPSWTQGAIVKTASTFPRNAV